MKTLGLIVGALLGVGFAGATSDGWAQPTGTVVGVVADVDGRALPGAQVVLVGSERRIEAGADGRFVLRGVPAGVHRLEASHIGHAPAVREVALTSGAAVELTFALRPTPLSVPGLVVTGSPTGGAALDLTRAATQLSGRALERSLSGSVAETLAGQPGLAVRYNGPGAASPVVRGLTGDRVVVMQDGQRSADLAGSADDHVVTIDPLSARRIEVIRGPAALLYGNNALGGVVNVLTSDVPGAPPARAEFTVAGQSESAFPGGTAAVRATVPLSDSWALGVRASGRSTGDVRLARGRSAGVVPDAAAARAPAADFGDRLPNTFSRNANGAISIGHGGARVTGGATLRVFGFAYGLPTPADEPEPVEIAGRVLSASGRAEVATGLTALPMVRVTGAVHDYAHDELEHGAVEMAFGLRTRSVDVLARQAAGLGGILDEGAWGVSASGRSYVATGVEQLTAPAELRALGAFTFQQLPLGRGGASFQLGARVDRTATESLPDPKFGPGTARAFTSLSGSVGLSAPLAPFATAAISVARSFRAPTVEELFSDAPHAGTAAYEIGDPTLRPETMRGVDAVIRLSGRRVHGEMAAYASRIADFVSFSAAGDTVVDGVIWPILAYVQSAGSMTGAEASLEWQAWRSAVLGASGDVVRGKLAGGGAIPFLPAARLAGTARWEPGSFSAGLALRHAFAQQRVSGGPDVPTAAYTLLDLDAGLHIVRGGRRHGVTLRAANLFDREYRDAASRIKRFAPNPGRNIALLYRVDF
jgi:iron complex outermembrane recepter protein